MSTKQNLKPRSVKKKANLVSNNEDINGYSFEFNMLIRITTLKFNRQKWQLNLEQENLRGVCWDF